jgi:hypothetical protein
MLFLTWGRFPPLRDFFSWNFTSLHAVAYDCLNFWSFEIPFFFLCFLQLMWRDSDDDASMGLGIRVDLDPRKKRDEML